MSFDYINNLHAKPAPREDSMPLLASSGEGLFHGRDIQRSPSLPYDLQGLFDDSFVESEVAEAEFDESEWVFVNPSVGLSAVTEDQVIELKGRLDRLKDAINEIKEDGSADLSNWLECLLQQEAMDTLLARLDSEHPQVGDNFRQVLRDHADDVTAIREHYHQFDVEMASARLTAQELHAQFLTARNGGELPRTDSATGLTTCSLADMKVAFEMARTAFPALQQTAILPRHDIEMARLVQTILCGSSQLDGVPMPSSPFCFRASELNDDAFPTANYEITPGKSPLEHFLDGIFGKQATRRACPVEAAGTFISDVVTRSGMTFNCGDLSLPCKSFEMESDRFILNVLRKTYYSHLAQNPSEIPLLIERAKSSSFLADAQHEFGAEGVSFNTETLESLMAATNKRVDTRALAQKAAFSEEQVDRLAELSGCDREAIANLMPAKVLEVMIVMNQGFVAASYEPFAVRMIGEYSLNPSSKERIFDYDRPDLTDMRNINTYHSAYMSGLGYAEGKIPMQLHEMLPMVKSDTTLHIPDPHAAAEAAVTYRPIGNVSFSWRAIPDVIDGIAASANIPAAQAPGWIWGTAARIAYVVSYAGYLNPFYWTRRRSV